MNNINIMGRISSDIEMKQTQSGTAVCSFNVAVDRDRQPKDGEKVTDFIPVVCWGKTAEFVTKYFAKGRMINVTGSLQSQKWTDKEGKNRLNWKVVAERVHFCGDKPAQQMPAQQMPAQNGYAAPAPQGIPQGVPMNQGYAPTPQQMPAAPAQGYAPVPQQGYAPMPQQQMPMAPAQSYAPAPQQGGYAAPAPQQMPMTGGFVPLADDGDLPF